MGTSLVAPGLRICLPMPGTWLLSLDGWTKIPHTMGQLSLHVPTMLQRLSPFTVTRKGSMKSHLNWRPMKTHLSQIIIFLKHLTILNWGSLVRLSPPLALVTSNLSPIPSYSFPNKYIACSLKCSSFLTSLLYIVLLFSHIGPPQKHPNWTLLDFVLTSLQFIL